MLTFHTESSASAPSRALKFETRHHPLAPPMFAMYRATQYTAQPLYVPRNMLSGPLLCRDYCSSSCLGAADRWPLAMAHVNRCASDSSCKLQHPLHECWGVIWIIQGSPKRQRLSDCVRWRTPSVQKRHLVTLDQHLAPFRCLFANADLLPQYLSREGGPPERPNQSAIPSKPNT